VSFTSALIAAAIVETRSFLTARLRVSATCLANVRARKSPRNISSDTPLRRAWLAASVIRCTTPSIDSSVRFVSNVTAAIAALRRPSGSPIILRIRSAAPFISDVSRPAALSNGSRFLIINPSRVLFVARFCISETTPEEEGEEEGEERGPFCGKLAQVSENKSPLAADFDLLLNRFCCSTRQRMSGGK
jgi:hypothetical protein